MTVSGDLCRPDPFLCHAAVCTVWQAPAWLVCSCAALSIARKLNILSSIQPLVWPETPAGSDE